MDEANKDKHPIIALFGEVLGFGALIAAWLALLGWSYAQTYFRLWGIPLSGSGVAFNNVIYHSAEVAQRSWIYVVLTLVMVISIGIVAYLSLRWINIVAAAFVAALGTAGLFGLGGWIGAEQARKDLDAMRMEAYVGLPRALILLERPPPQDATRASILKDELSKLGCYRILYMGEDMLWTVRPRPLNLDGFPTAEAPAVLGLPRSEVMAVRLLGHRPNCP